MPTAQALIDTAFTELRVKSPDTDMADQEYADALSRLNGMMESRSADISTLGTSTVVNADVTGTFPMTVGPSGDFDVARPSRVLAVSWSILTGYPSHLEMVPLDVFRTLRMRHFSDPNTPVVAYYQPEFPLGRLRVWPQPTMGAFNLQVLAPRYIWADLTTDVDLPPGLQLAIEYQLAIELAGQYQISAGQELVSKAEVAWAAFAQTAEVL